MVQLQDSCREARNDAAELRKENTRLSSTLDSLRHECREREKYLRALWYARRRGPAINSAGNHVDDFPAPPASFACGSNGSNGNGNGNGASSSSLGTPVSTPLLAHHSVVNYGGAGSSDGGLDAAAVGLGGFSAPHEQLAQQQQQQQQQQGGYSDTPGSASAYSDRSPVMPFLGQNGSGGEQPHAHANNGRSTTLHLTKMEPYGSYLSSGHVRDTGWGPTTMSPTTQGGGSESMTGQGGSAGHSPAFIPSPTITSNDIPYGAQRYAMHDAQKAGGGIDAVSPYMMSNSADRSLSPIATSPHATTSSASSSMGQFPFTFASSDAQERAEAEYHQHHQHQQHQQHHGLRLHGGTADISSYGMTRRRTNTGPERPMLGSAPSYHADALNGEGGSQGVVSPASIVGGGVRRRRSADEHSSRSPSPSTPGSSGTAQPPISSTLAVIKAQAFGALRRTRARAKKAGGNDGGVKMALGALEARAIGLGLADSSPSSNKRMRVSEDDDGQL